MNARRVALNLACIGLLFAVPALAQQKAAGGTLTIDLTVRSRGAATWTA